MLMIIMMIIIAIPSAAGSLYNPDRHINIFLSLSFVIVIDELSVFVCLFVDCGLFFWGES